MNTTARKVICSKSRLRSVVVKRNTKGYHSLNQADLIVFHAAQAETLTVVPDSHLDRGSPVGKFFQIFA